MSRLNEPTLLTTSWPIPGLKVLGHRNFDVFVHFSDFTRERWNSIPYSEVCGKKSLISHHHERWTEIWFSVRVLEGFSDFTPVKRLFGLSEDARLGEISVNNRGLPSLSWLSDSPFRRKQDGANDLCYYRPWNFGVPF